VLGSLGVGGGHEAVLENERPVSPLVVARSVASVWGSGKAQALLFLAAFALYRIAYGLTTSTPGLARAHGHSILSAERSLGLAIEPSLQAHLHALSGFFTVVYLCAQLLVIWLVLAWSWRAGRPVYRRLRAAVLGSWVFGIACFAAWPAAPPRFVPDAGVANSVADALGATNPERATSIYNPYAAMPSLHCAFALLAGLTIWHTVRSRWRAFGILWPAAVGLATVATGNHWVLDVVAGYAVAGTAWVLGARVVRHDAAAVIPARNASETAIRPGDGT
jgi:membrane-associated phospholipid phosphatase